MKIQKIKKTIGNAELKKKMIQLLWGDGGRPDKKFKRKFMNDSSNNKSSSHSTYSASGASSTSSEGIAP